MAATIRDVAARAGVSVSTVSNYLCGRMGRMRPETRRRIEEAISELDFHVNMGARELASGQSSLIGILHQASNLLLTGHSYFSLFLAAVQTSVFARGYQLLVASCQSAGEAQEPRVRSFVRRRVEGVLLTNRTEADAGYQLLNEAGIPFVAQYRFQDEVGGYAVVFDYGLGGRLVAEHFVELGHRRVGIITGYRGYAHHTQREQGFRAVLEKAGLELPAALSIEADASPEGGAAAMRRLLSDRNPPTAVFATSDFIALGAISQARKLGRRVPDDVAVAGFDDVEFAQHLDPSLTSVSRPVQQSGLISADMLLQLIGGGKPEPRVVVLPVQLVKRESTLGSHSTSKQDPMALPLRDAAPAQIGNDAQSVTSA